MVQSPFEEFKEEKPKIRKVGYLAMMKSFDSQLYIEKPVQELDKESAKIDAEGGFLEGKDKKSDIYLRMVKDFARIPNKIPEMDVFRINRVQNIPSTKDFSIIPQILLKRKRYKGGTKPIKHKLTNNEKQGLYNCVIKYGLPEGLRQFLGLRNTYP